MGRKSKQIFFQRRHTDDQHIHKKMHNMTSHQGNANQNHRRIPITPTISATVKRQVITSGSEDAEKLKPSYLAAETVKRCSLCGTVWKFLSKLNTEFL